MVTAVTKLCNKVTVVIKMWLSFIIYQLSIININKKKTNLLLAKIATNVISIAFSLVTHRSVY